MNIVGVFGSFSEVSGLIEITVHYCLNVTFYTSQGSAATIYMWGGYVYTS